MRGGTGLRLGAGENGQRPASQRRPRALRAPGRGTPPGRRARDQEGSRGRRQGGKFRARRLCTRRPNRRPYRAFAGATASETQPGATSCPGGPAISGSGRGPGRRRRRGVGGASCAQRARGGAGGAQTAHLERTWSPAGARSGMEDGVLKEGFLVKRVSGQYPGGGSRSRVPSPRPTAGSAARGQPRGPGLEGGFRWNGAAGAQAWRKGPLG